MNQLSLSLTEPPGNGPQTARENRAILLVTLRAWSDQGWLRRLDSALAGLLAELDPEASPALLVSAALLGHMEGRGHTCLALASVTEPAQAQSLLDWPPLAQASLHKIWQMLPSTLAQWLAALRASPMVRTVGMEDAPKAANVDPPDQGQPLVLAISPVGPLLYLRRYWLQEQQLALAVAQRVARHTPVNEGLARRWLDRLFDSRLPTGTQNGDMDWQKLACAVALRASLTVISGGPGTGKTYTAARLLALLFALAPQAQHLRVALAAPTGKAAARLRQSIDNALQELQARIGLQETPSQDPAHAHSLDLVAFAQRIGPARTLHALLGARPGTGQFRFNARQPLDVDIVIVDEASMVHLEMMAALLQALPSGARLILLGDKDQLASVEAGAVLGDLCDGAGTGQYDAQTARYAAALTGTSLDAQFLAPGPSGQAPIATAPALAQQTVMLHKSRRFGGNIGKLALAVNAGDSAVATELLENDPSGTLYASPAGDIRAVLRLAVHGRAEAPACFADYLRLIQAGPRTAPADDLRNGPSDRTQAHSTWATAVLRAFDRFRLVCAVHEGDWGTRSLNLAAQQALVDAGLLKARGEWFIGRPVMVARNDTELGVFNGDVGITLPAPDSAAPLRVYFLDGETLRSVASARLPSVETAFAMTVHKCQGSEFGHTALVLPSADARVLTRELVYTGITRARERFTLLQAQPTSLQAAIARPSVRVSGLAHQLAAQEAALGNARPS
jgi:exodeoxyribonuclease V alpha subunit